MLIKREIDEFLSKRMFSGKVLVVYGPRQAGKTTSIEHYISENGLSSETLIFNGDETVDRDLLADASAEKLKLLIGKKKVVFIDEAQKIPEIGIVLKRFYDKIKDVQVIASGSSSDELAQKTEEPLTGRKFECVLLPLSFSELAGASSPIDEMRLLERRLMFGSYPDVVTHAGDEVSRIREIGKGYLYKDILKYEEIKRPELIDKLLRALAFQIGQEVSFSELAQVVGSDPKTVSKYIDVLEKAFIVFKLGSYSRNLRNELKKSRKVYFYDLGIRNYILGDWRALNLRGSDEVGHIWENYFISERRKYIMAYTPETRMFFWRTQQRQEVDLIEETASGLSAYEVKWNPAKLNKAMSKTFLSAYPQAECHGVSPQNYISYFLK